MTTDVIGDQDFPRVIEIQAHDVCLSGALVIPPEPKGVILFAHGSGSGRLSPRNQFVGRRLRDAGLATLLIDLLTDTEGQLDEQSAEFRFDIPFLAGRLNHAIDWLARSPQTRSLSIGLFGASTGAAAALMVAAQEPRRISAVVSRGGRPDLAAEALPRTLCPTLLIVGGDDRLVLDLNRKALARLGSTTKQLVVIPGAGHLFEEPGKLEQVARLAMDWFTLHREPPA